MYNNITPGFVNIPNFTKFFRREDPDITFFHSNKF